MVEAPSLSHLLLLEPTPAGNYMICDEGAKALAANFPQGLTMLDIGSKRNTRPPFESSRALIVGLGEARHLS